MNLKEQYQLNKDIETFVRGKFERIEKFSSDDLAYINQYAGYGGMWNLDSELPKERGLYEYYTPIDVIEKMVGLAYKYGFTEGGKVCEPSCGIGRFLHYFKPNSEVWAFEPDEVSFLIARANFPTFNFMNQTFNEVFVERNGKAKPLSEKSKNFDLVIGNPPYGAFEGKLTSAEKDKTGATTYPEYFITRGLDLLRSGGLLIYIIPSSFLDGKENYVKKQILAKSNIVDAYRLPVGIFDATSIGTDIIVFQKN